MPKVVHRLWILCVAVLAMSMATGATTATAVHGHPDLVWFTAESGVVSAWLLNGTRTVQGKQDLDWACTAASDCSTSWKPIGIG
jgi:hypothetical protein